jgi:oligopeptide/dipeptide ABC transporter ATP-binding protein
LGVSYLFIAHDLAAVTHLSHQMAVMYLGKIVEVAESLELCAKPLHPYTKALFATSLLSHPDEAKEEVLLTGEVPSALNPPSGCHFHQIRAQFKAPEEINDGETTAPSKRLQSLYPGYDKILFDPLIAQRIGLDKLRQECPHFRDWMSKLEALVQA